MEQKLLQIIHISDLHLATAERRTKSVESLDRYRSYRFLKRLAPAAARAKANHRLMQGLAGHEPEALRMLTEKIEELLRSEESDGFPSWLIVTGDLTTWGEPSQMTEAMNSIATLARECGCNSYVVYGNHDVWADAFPLSATNGYLANNRTMMRDRYFYGKNWPEGPFTLADDQDSSRIELYSLNTVVHERVQNSLGWGYVRSDWYWVPNKVRDDQLQLIRNKVSADREIPLRLMATHHPVYDPEDSLAAARANMLLNSESVVHTLIRKDRKADFRIFLSGHTHVLFPAFSELPELPTVREPMNPLSNAQLQLTVGTACQSSLSTTESTQNFQVLRFFTSEREQGEIRMERIVFSRNMGLGDFAPLCSDDDPKATAEEVYF